MAWVKRIKKFLIGLGTIGVAIHAAPGISGTQKQNANPSKHHAARTVKQSKHRMKKHTKKSILSGHSIQNKTTYKKEHKKTLTNTEQKQNGSSTQYNKDTQQNVLENKIIKENPNINKNMVKEALKAWAWAKEQHKVKKASNITMVDYSQPSNEKRLYIIDTNSGKTILQTYVAHGMKSGLTTANYFSNTEDSHASCLGALVTGETYNGKHGLSMRLKGLEKGVNDAAYARDIVVHSASYVSKAFIEKHHRTGRSWGCLAVGKDVLPQVIKLTKGGSFIFSYSAAEQHDPLFKA